MPEQAFQARRTAKGEVNAQLQGMNFALRDLRRASKTAYGGETRMTPIDTHQVDDALHGAVPLHELPELMRGPTASMRNHIDALSRTMVKIGLVDGPLVGVFEENEGFYVTRQYEIFDFPEAWPKKVPLSTRNAAEAWFRAEYPDWTDNQVQHEIETLLYAGKKADTPMAWLAQGKIGAKDLSILQHRKEIPAPIRALWGEYHDARVNYVKSVNKMARLIANHQFLKTAREEGLGNFFWEPNDPNIPPEAVAQIAAEGSDAMSPLNGLYTTPEVKRAFEQTYKTSSYPWFLRLYYIINGSAKFSKTVLSPQTHVRNFLANALFMVTNGHWRFWNSAKAFNAIAAKHGWGDTAGRRAYVQELHRRGLMGEGARAGEMEDVIQDMVAMSPHAFMDNAAKKLAKATSKGLTHAYHAEDDFWKIVAWESEKARYTKAKPDWSKEQVAAHAAEIVRNTMPTYSLVPELIKQIRRFPLVGAFVSFQAEIVRGAGNTFAQTRQELADPELRGIGLQRVAGMMLAATITAAMTAAARYLVGVTDDEDKDLRRFMAPWTENSQIIHLGDNGKQVYDIIDFSYTDPYAILRTPFIAFTRGENWEQGLLDGMSEFLAPFISHELLSGAMLEIRDKYNPDAGWDYNSNMAASVLYKVLEPGGITSARRIAKGVTGTVSKYGKAYDAKLEILAATTGHRITQVDVRQGLSYRAGDFQRRLSNSTSLVSTVASRRGVVTQDELAEAYQRADAARRSAFAGMAEDAAAAIRLGVPKKEVGRILRSGGVSERNVTKLLEKGYVPWKPQGDFLDTAKKRARTASTPGAATANDFEARRSFLLKLSGQ
jgi:hypothetical protein